jgi:hypothetical protein
MSYPSGIFNWKTSLPQNSNLKVEEKFEFGKKRKGKGIRNGKGKKIKCFTGRFCSNPAQLCIHTAQPTPEARADSWGHSVSLLFPPRGHWSPYRVGPPCHPLVCASSTSRNRRSRARRETAPKSAGR